MTSFPELRGSVDDVRYPAFVDLKLDGEAYAYINSGIKGDEGRLVNKTDKILTDLPCIRELDSIFEGRSVTLYGELYCGEGKNGDLYTLLSAKSKAKDTLKFKPYDIVWLDNEDIAKESTLDRKEILTSIMEAIETKLVQSKDEAVEAFKEATARGYEGVVVKGIDTVFTCGATPWAKIKFKDQSDYKVTTVDPTKDRIEVDVAGRIVGVKVGKERLSLLPGDTVTIEHQGVLSGGGLRHPQYKGRTK